MTIYPMDKVRATCGSLKLHGAIIKVSESSGVFGSSPHPPTEYTALLCEDDPTTEKEKPMATIGERMAEKMVTLYARAGQYSISFGDHGADVGCESPQARQIILAIAAAIDQAVKDSAAANLDTDLNNTRYWQTLINEANQRANKLAEQLRASNEIPFGKPATVELSEAKPPRWEYCVLDYNDDPREPRESVLNYRGRAGWELVGEHFMGASNYGFRWQLTFKRRLK
jgi:hypothetical protein